MTEEWIKKMWCIYTMEYYSTIKQERNNAICSNMNGPRECHIEWSKSEEERGRDREFEMSVYTLLYLKWRLTRTYCIAQWTAQCYVTPWMGRRFEGKNGYMYMHGWVPSLFTYYHNIVLIAYTPMQNKKLKKIPVS